MAIVVEPASVSLVLGGQEQLDAYLVDALGFRVESGPPVWGIDLPEIATLSADGQLTAMRPGVASIEASIGTFSKSASLSVADGDLAQCCIDAGNVSGFCEAAPGTSACPMTLPGGYCDPNGDASFDDADWVLGYYEYQGQCM